MGPSYLLSLSWQRWVLEIGHGALPTNKFVEVSIVFGHGVSSLVGGAVALGCCCATGRLPWLGVNGLSSSWNFLVGLGISWILLWARLYTINGIRLGLAVVVVGFTTEVCVEVTVVGAASGSGLTGKDLSTSLTYKHLFMGVLVLLFLSAAFLGTGGLPWWSGFAKSIGTCVQMVTKFAF